MKRTIVSLVAFLAAALSAQNTLSRNELQNIRQIGEAFERAERYQQAADYYQRALAADPADRLSYLGFKRACAAAGDYQRFKQVVLTLQARRRDVLFAVDLAWADYYLGKQDEAVRALKRVVEENLKDEEAYRLVGETFAELDLKEEAIAVYRRSRTELKKETLFAVESAELLTALQRYEEAVEEYLALTSEEPQQISFVRTMISRQSADVKCEQLTKLLAKAEKKRPQAAWATSILHADCLARNRQFDLAVTMYANAEKRLAAFDRRPPMPPGELLYRFAEDALRSDEAAAAEQAFRLLIDNLPNSPYAASARTKIADVYLARRNYQGAEEALLRLTAESGRSVDAAQVWERLGELYLGRLFNVEKAERAFTQAREAYRAATQKNSLLIPLAKCALVRGDFGLAEERLEAAYRFAAGSQEAAAVEALLHLSRLHFYRHDLSRAKETVKQALAEARSEESLNDVNDLLHLSMLLQEGEYDSLGAAVYASAELLVQQKREEEACRALERRLAEAPAARLSSELRLLLAQIYASLDRAEAADTYFSVYKDESSLSRDYALFCLAELYEKRGDRVRAQEYYETLITEFPNSIYVDEGRNRLRRMEKRGVL